ncbi:MAG TPA: hypothetical protein VHE35_14490 [Kofleriaceae bacterium]|nr:hypothetical protein [Kofleriaceae bacterium]
MLAAVALAACGGDDGAGTVDAPAAIDAPGLDAGIDAANACSHQPCSILPQCGCEQTPSTPVCDLDFDMPAGAATKCRADMFGGTEGTTCSRATTCAAEYVCVGRCRHYCDDDSDCAGPGGLCIQPLEFDGAPLPGIKLCTTSCAPSSTTNPLCPTGWGCHLYREDSGDRRYFSECEPAPATGGDLGDACQVSKDCQAGLDCFNDGSGMGLRCTANCLCPGGDCSAGVCPAGAGTCHGYTTPATLGTATYGRCYL